MKRAKLSYFPRTKATLTGHGIIHSDGEKMAYQNRLVAVFGPCPTELLGFGGYSFDWKRVAAGLEKPSPHDGTLDMPTEPSLDMAQKGATVAYDWSASEVMRGILAVEHLAVEDSPRNYGTVVCLDPKGFIVATDGFRLAASQTFATQALKGQVCLPKAAVKMLAKFAGIYACDSVSIADDQTTMVFAFGPYRVYVRTSAVKYPNYLAVIPVKHTLEQKDEGVLTAALAAVKPKVKAAKPTEEIRVTFEGSTFNARFLLDTKNPPTSVFMARNDPEAPMLVETEGAQYTFVPIKVNA